MPSKHVLANREANSRHTYDVTIWLSRTTDNSNIFIRSLEVRDNESRLYLNTIIYLYVCMFTNEHVPEYQPHFQQLIDQFPVVL